MSSSLAPIVTNICGQSLTVIGQCIALVAAVYIGEIFFTTARMVLEYLPAIIVYTSGGGTVITGSEPMKHVANPFQNLVNYVTDKGTKFIILLLFVGLGMLVKFCGNFMVSPTFTNYFYGN